MRTIEFEAIQSPVWADNEHSAVTLTVKVAGVESELPFTASPDDSAPYGVDLYRRALAEEFGSIAPYAPPVMTEPMARAQIERALRAVQLQLAPLRDAEDLGVLTQDEATQLMRLRQHSVALMRLPASSGWPLAIAWPLFPQ